MRGPISQCPAYQDAGQAPCQKAFPPTLFSASHSLGLKSLQDLQESFINALSGGVPLSVDKNEATLGHLATLPRAGLTTWMGVPARGLHPRGEQVLLWCRRETWVFAVWMG